MFDRAIQLWKKGSNEEAVQHFIALTKAYPNHGLVEDALFWVANLYHYKLKEPEQAVHFYKLLQKRPQSVYYSRSLFQLAEIYLENKEEEKAIFIYQQLQKQDDENVDKVRYLLSKAYFSLGKFEQARASIKKLIIGQPDMVAGEEYLFRSYLLVAKSYQREKKFLLAKEFLEEMKRLFPQPINLIKTRLYLAKNYEEMGKLVSAKSIYQKLLQDKEQKSFLQKAVLHRIRKIEKTLLQRPDLSG